MSASNACENSLILLVFNNTAFAAVGDAAGLLGSAAAGSLYVSLHSADPGEAGTQATSETTYTNYARVAVARAAGGWTASGTAPTQAANAATVTFAAGGATGQTVTHFGVGTASTGVGVLLFSGALTSSLAVSSGITPSFAAGQLSVTAD